MKCKYTLNDVRIQAKKVDSIAGLCRALGLKPIGGNYFTMKKKLAILKIDCSHWKGQAWNRNNFMPIEDYKCINALRQRMLREHDGSCYNCKLSKWLDQHIVLELHHIDGDRANNQLDNLQLLCPNCHSLTSNWRGRKNGNSYNNCKKPNKNPYKPRKHRKFNKFNSLCFCGKPLNTGYKYCSKTCCTLSQRKIKWPDINELIDMVEGSSYRQVGFLLGVSDVSIRKHIKKHGK